MSGRDGELELLNRQAVRIANEIAAEGGALVAGNICNTWCFDPADPVNSGAVVREQYREQLGWAKEEGVDFVISETNDFLGEAMIGLEVCHELGLPALVTFASVQPETTYDGHAYLDACRMLADHGAAAVGFNCSRGPATLMPLLEQLRAAVDIPVVAQPVPYRTSSRGSGLRVARDGGRDADVPDPARECGAHPVRDGAVREGRRRDRRRLHRGVLWWVTARRPGDGRGARSRDGGEPLLPRARTAPGARHRRVGTVAHEDMGDWSAAAAS